MMKYRGKGFLNILISCCDRRKQDKNILIMKYQDQKLLLIEITSDDKLNNLNKRISK